jgi:hypothetical protein
VTAAAHAISRPRSFLGQLLAAVAIAVPALRKSIAVCVPLVREHMTTVAAFAAVNMGIWQFSWRAGLISSGLSLFLLEFRFRG